MEKARESVQTVEEESRSLSRLKNGFEPKTNPKADCLVSA
jgi:hypothetical protein